MRNIIMISILLVIVSCNTNKSKLKAKKDNRNIEIIEESEDIQDVVKYEPTNDPKADKDLLDPKQGVIVVFNSENTETEKLINQKGLKLEKMLLDQNSLKVGLIKVPADKKEYWLNRLMESGEFKDVKLYSEKNLKRILKN